MDIHLKLFIQEVKKLRDLQKRAASSLNHSSTDFSSRRQLLAMAANQEKEVDRQIDYLTSDHFQQELPF
jgi:hypothetical protein